MVRILTFPVFMLVCLLAVTAAFAALPGNVRVAPATFEDRFGAEPPAGWQLAEGKAVSERIAPENALVEAVFALPEALEANASVSLAIGTLTGKATFGPKGAYSAQIAGAGADGKPVTISVPGIKAAAGEMGWAGRRVALGMTVGADRCRLLLDGNVMAECSPALPAERKISLAFDKGATPLAVRALPGIPDKFFVLTGAGLAALHGSERVFPAKNLRPAAKDGVRLDVGGVPLLAQGGEGGLAAIDIAAEQFKNDFWTEGSGFIRFPVPARPYKNAYLLIYRQGANPAETPALGFGLRVPDGAPADLRNVYVEKVPVRSSDEGVAVQPVPGLGPGWYLATVRMNPSATHWATHKADNTLLPLGNPSFKERPAYQADTAGLSTYLCRPWAITGDGILGNRGLPHPERKPSSLRVAAVTFEDADFDLQVIGNGLGNIYSEPEQPKLSATLTNRTAAPITINVTSELIPFERPAAKRTETVKLGPGESKVIDALVAPILERGHFKVRVVADAGAAGRTEYRTNVALLAPDTRKKENSPFGIWVALWGDGATEKQRQYIKDKAGIGFIMGKHSFDIRGPAAPDDAAAEKLVKSLSPDVKIFMFGWESGWGYDQTFVFPRVITEGKEEELSAETNKKIDEWAADWRRVAAAIRKYRPDIKISLGNSGMNFVTPFLQRGFKQGVEFDYFGTEEGYYSQSPEQVQNALGNVNWWTKAVLEHYGFKNVPIFHSEAIYQPTGPGFSRITERDQAGFYTRAYLLGMPYNSIYGFTAAPIDSGNGYMYSQWGMVGYCNQAPECSPKLSYVAYATLTQQLDGAKYERAVDTGSLSVYALAFTLADGTPVTALWNPIGKRSVTALLAAGGQAAVFDALNRPVAARVQNNTLTLELSDLPVYVRGARIEQVVPGANLPETLPNRKLLVSLDKIADWTVETGPDPTMDRPFELGDWGVKKVPGQFTMTLDRATPPGVKAGGSMKVAQQPGAPGHPYLPRYATLRLKPGKEVAIPAGTNELGLWVYGNSTNAQIKLEFEAADGRRFFALDYHGDYRCPDARYTDLFDGWHFLRTGDLDEDFKNGACKLVRIVVVMPEQQVYIDNLVSTPKPEILLSGLYAIGGKPAAVNYQPW
ncbi:MAG: hypothetical protein ACYDCO_19115 [Armatimonadota bacterium]